MIRRRRERSHVLSKGNNHPSCRLKPRPRNHPTKGDDVLSQHSRKSKPKIGDNRTVAVALTN
jgi:hypothetical protein